jgi:hypothetical protein
MQTNSPSTLSHLPPSVRVSGACTVRRIGQTGAVEVRAMTNAEWLALMSVRDLLQRSAGRVSARKLRLFACQCAGSIVCFSPEVSCHDAVHIAEELTDGIEAPDARRVTFDRLQAYCDRTANAEQCIAEAALATLDPNPHAAAERAQEWAVAFDSEVGSGSLPVVEWFRCIVGDPFHPIVFDPAWCTDTVAALAGQMHQSRDFSAMPILADALQDAGCDNDDILTHCRGPGPHVRRCWVLGRE